MACAHWAQKIDKQYWPIKVALVRDTRKNLGNTTGRTLLNWFPKYDKRSRRGLSRWKGKEGEWDSCIVMHRGQDLLEFGFFGVDNPGDLNRFQSYECAIVWLEEVAPAADVVSGVSEEAFALATTSLRQVPGFRRVQISMNAPSRQDWVSRIFLNDLSSMPELGDEERQAIIDIRANSAVFWIPRGENVGIDEAYREANRMALLAAGRADLVTRLVEGRVSDVQVGESVTPEFSEDHIVDGLLVNPYRELIMSWDFGLYPACLISQILPTGHVGFHKAWCVRNIGTKQMCEQHVLPWLAEQRLKLKVDRFTIRHMGGWEGMERSQVNSEETPVRTIMQTIGGVQYIPGPVAWPERRDAAKDGLLRRTGGGVPWIRINRQECEVLIRALQGGWHYKKLPSGEVIRDAPVKDSSSHPGDAFAAQMAILLQRNSNDPREAWERKQEQRGRLRVREAIGGTRT